MSLVIRGHRLFVFFLVIILFIGSIFLIRPIIAISNQIRAGSIIDKTLGSHSWMPPCESLDEGNEIRRNQLSNAIKLLDQAISYEPYYLQSYLQLGKALCLVGEYSEAENVLRKASLLRPNNYLAEIERGFVLEKVCPPNGECDNGESSVTLWKSAEITASQFISNAESAYNHQDYNQAIFWYIRAQEMGADLHSTISFIRFRHCEKIDPNCARLALSEAIQIDSGWANPQIHFLAWFYYGRLMFTEHEWKSAELFLQQAITFYPGGTSLNWDLSDIHRLLGLMLADQENYEQALIQLEEAVNLYPKSYWAHIHLGAILYESNPNNLSTTKTEFDLGLKLAGNNEVVWDEVIRFWIQFNQLNLAEEYCSMANKNGMDMSEIKHCLGK